MNRNYTVPASYAAQQSSQGQQMFQNILNMMLMKKQLDEQRKDKAYDREQDTLDRRFKERQQTSIEGGRKATSDYYKSLSGGESKPSEGDLKRAFIKTLDPKDQEKALRKWVGLEDEDEKTMNPYQKWQVGTLNEKKSALDALLAKKSITEEQYNRSLYSIIPEASTSLQKDIDFIIENKIGGATDYDSAWKVYNSRSNLSNKMEELAGILEKFSPTKK